MARTTPTDVELDGMAHHVVYDLWMLREASHLCGVVGALRLGRPWMCAAVESFGMHLRNLLGFLYPPPASDLRNGDVVASDYLEGYTVDADELLEGVAVTEWKRRVSRKLAHVHTDRLVGVPWPAPALADVITARFAAFVAQLPDESAYAERFDDQLKTHGLAVYIEGTDTGLIDVVGLSGEGLP